MIEWWTDLPWQLRMGVARLLIGISTGLWFAGYLWMWGWMVGAILFCFSFPSRDEQ